MVFLTCAGKVSPALFLVALSDRSSATSTVAPAGSTRELTGMTLGYTSPPDSTRVESGGDVYPSVIPVNSRVLPAGATVEVALDRSLSATRNNAGDTFPAHVRNTITAQDG